MTHESANAAYWFFGVLFTTGVTISLISLEAMRKQVNLLRPANQTVRLMPTLPRWHFFSQSAHIMELHKESYPKSMLRGVQVLSWFITLLGLIGFAAYVG